MKNKKIIIISIAIIVVLGILMAIIKPYYDTYKFEHLEKENKNQINENTVNTIN